MATLDSSPSSIKKDLDATEEKTLSKTQLKKLKRKEKREQGKAQKRKAEKERFKARKRACIERGETLGPTRKQLRRNQMKNSKCKIKVAVDCDFDDYMSEKDINMLVKQIQFSYSANRRAENPLQFYCCGVGGKTKSRLDSMGDYKHWDVHFKSASYLDVFEKSSIVYLSSESPNVLERLEEDKVYIIGGLVDHNHHKGLCHKLAEEKGLAHAQLPISDYIDMKTRKVLTINHVFEILLHYTETQDWQKSFYTVLPPRKGAVPKSVMGLSGDAPKSESDMNTAVLETDIESSTRNAVQKQDSDSVSETNETVPKVLSDTNKLEQEIESDSSQTRTSEVNKVNGGENGIDKIINQEKVVEEVTAIDTVETTLDEATPADLKLDQSKAPS